MRLITAIAFAIVAALWAGLTLAATTCSDLLPSNSYDCDFTNELGARFTGCFGFGTPDGLGIPIHGNLIAGLEIHDGFCSCLPTGSVGNPHFDASKSFDCLTTISGTTINVIWAGNAGKTGIFRGHSSSGGFNTIFTCKKSTGVCQ